MSWMDRLWNVFRGQELSRGLDEELEFHIDARIRDNIKSGMSAEEAGRDARLRFGNRTLTKERTREMNILASLENLAQDLRYALRSLRKSPGFTAVAMLALALGIGANTAVFTVVKSVLLRGLPFPGAERLAAISYRPQHGPFESEPGMVDGDYLAFRRQNQAFERIATYSGNPMTLTGAGDPVRLPAATVTPDFFPTLGVTAAIGRTFLAEEDQKGRDQVVVLSDKLWRSRFVMDPNVLGKTITVDGALRKVIGVMPPGFQFPSDAELWSPLEVRLDPNNSFLRPTVGRLKPGVSRQQAQSELEVFVSGLPVTPGDNRRDMRAEILPLKDVLVRNIRKSLLVFAGAVVFVLLIACANVANLLLMRAAGRQQEIAVRAALGASRWRLVRQLLTESVLVSLGGGAAGLLLAVVGVPALVAMAPAGKIPRLEEIQIDRWVLAFTFGIAMLTGIVFGLAPAFHVTRNAARRELRESLNRSGRALTGRNAGPRTALVVLEIAMALVLLTGAGLMLKSFKRMRAVNPGFRAGNVLTMTVDLPDSVYRTPAELKAFHERTLDKLAALPGVVAAGAVNWMPLAGPLIIGDFQIEGGRKLPRGFLADKPSVSSGYFRVMGIRLLAGRYFSAQDIAAAPGVAIVSQTVARRLWPGEYPVGKRISMEEHPTAADWLTIVGVVADIVQSDLRKQPSATVYQPYIQVHQPFFLSHMNFVVRTASNPQSIAPALRAVLREVDKDQPVQSVSTMDEVLSATIAEPRFQGRLLAAFSMLALVLAVIGIYGVLAYSVAERTHEIGIRMALGAEKNAVLAMVLRRTLVLAGAGIALGTAGALGVTRVLEKFLFEVTPTDPAVFGLVAVVLAAAALLAGLLPARRATRVDPVIALRYE